MGWFFPGHWRTLSTPSHLLGFHPGSRLCGGRQGHSNPPTTRADVAGEGGARLLSLSSTQLWPGSFSISSDPSHARRLRFDEWFQGCLFTTHALAKPQL